MSIFKCKMCGGTIEFEAGASVGVCDSCGTKQTLPRLDSDRKANLYDRANHFRRNNEFDKAAGIYEQILTEDNSDAEAYWSLVLCRYGIEYVEDPATHRRVPTVNRTQFTSVFDDDNYKSAIRCADIYQRGIYEEEAKAINDIQKGILAISQNEEPFDVFICYKETDASGRRTPDSVLATDLYHQLTQEGFKVFFARITLEDKLGTAYEPYIFAALNSAKVMVVLGTKPEHFNAVWVKNEWSRYLALVKQSGGKKVLIPAYRDMDPYDLPEEFSHLQAQDMSKLGFMQDLIRGIKKIAKADEPKQTVIKETVTVQNDSGNMSAILDRGFLALEDGEWDKADGFFEQALNFDAKNARAYLGKLMAEQRVRRQEDLADRERPFDGSSNYQKAVRFGGSELSATLKGYIVHINERNENARLTGIYDSAVSAMNAANTESAYKAAAKTFKTIPGFKDADALAEQCLDKAEVCRKDAIYSSAKAKMNAANTESAFMAAAASFKMIPGFKDADALAEQCLDKAEVCRKDAIYASAKAKMTGDETDGYEAAIKEFGTISGWKDADEQINVCRRKIEEIKAKEEADRLERERQAEQRRVAAEKRKKLIKKTAIIGTPILAAVIAFVILLTTVIIPTVKYSAAVDLYNAGNYDEAIMAFIALNGYKDSATQITKCETAINDAKYNAAVDLYNEGKYDEAITAFKALNGYKDSATQITKCEAAINDFKYYSAIDLYIAGKYDEAITAFTALNGYKDSDSQLEKCYMGKFGEEKYNLIKNIKVGDMYKFGSYEQDNKSANGKEEIEWIVLDKDGMSLLLISNYALDCQQFNTNRTDVTWETCSLRKWLNGTFLNAAFSSTEQNSIINTTVTEDKNQVNCVDYTTTDRVFLLSITEVNEYFSLDSARECQLTAYCFAQGALKASNSSNCEWWLRSRRLDSDRAAIVNNDGSVHSHGYYVDSDDVAVRPAMWIDLGS